MKKSEDVFEIYSTENFAKQPDTSAGNCGVSVIQIVEQKRENSVIYISREI